MTDLVKHLLWTSVILLLVIGFGQAYATDQVLITISPAMANVVFDGKWTFYEEWKESSLDTFIYPDGTTIYFRSAHYKNFIYFMIDDVSDVSFSKGSDRATICLSENNNETLVPNSNDYCFVNTLSSKTSYVLQGGSPLALTGHFKKIDNPASYIGIAAISGDNDHYTPVPHASYEFRIPIDFIGRSDIYSMYVQIYHANSNKYYSWPTNSIPENLFQIASPTEWGQLISPDKTLPEFNLPEITLTLSLILVLYQIRKKSC